MRILEPLKKLLPTAFARGATAPQPPSPSTKRALSPEEAVGAIAAVFDRTGGQEDPNIRTMVIADRTIALMEYFFRGHSDTLKFVGTDPTANRLYARDNVHRRYFKLTEGTAWNSVTIKVDENGEGKIIISNHMGTGKNSPFSIAGLPIDKAVATIFQAFVAAAPESVRKSLMADYKATAQSPGNDRGPNLKT